MQLLFVIRLHVVDVEHLPFSATNVSERKRKGTMGTLLLHELKGFYMLSPDEKP